MSHPLWFVLSSSAPSQNACQQLDALGIITAVIADGAALDNINNKYINALNAFLDSESEYGVMLRDHLTLSPDLPALIDELTGDDRAGQWDIVRLAGHSAPFPLLLAPLGATRPAAPHTITAPLASDSQRMPKTLVSKWWAQSEQQLRRFLATLHRDIIAPPDAPYHLAVSMAPTHGPHAILLNRKAATHILAILMQERSSPRNTDVFERLRAHGLIERVLLPFPASGEEQKPAAILPLLRQGMGTQAFKQSWNQAWDIMQGHGLALLAWLWAAAFPTKPLGKF